MQSNSLLKDEDPVIHIYLHFPDVYNNTTNRFCYLKTNTYQQIYNVIFYLLIAENDMNMRNKKSFFDDYPDTN